MKTKVGMHVRKMATTDILSNSAGGRGKAVPSCGSFRKEAVRLSLLWRLGMCVPS